MISIKSDREIELMRIAGKYLSDTFKYIEKYIKTGVTTKKLDTLIHDYIISIDCVPSCLGYEGYPATACISINDEVVHGIPKGRKIKNGDIVSIDLVLSYKGYHADATRTYIIGNVSDEVRNLVNDTKGAFYAGVKKVKEGARVMDISCAIEEYAHAHGLSVVEELCGHGIGTDMHEDPNVPNYGASGTGPILKAGMVICIEPMLNLGTDDIYEEDDGWTIRTEDGKSAAHYEHTVLITKDGYEILTPRLD